MRVTGVIRRIDDLGRIVIPKDIRKTLKFSYGDPLEFFTCSADGKNFLCLSKVGEENETEKEVCKTFTDLLGKNYLTDLEKDLLKVIIKSIEDRA